MKIDETLKNNLIADVENMVFGIDMSDETKEALKRCFEITIGHHYGSLAQARKPQPQTPMEQVREAFEPIQLGKEKTDLTVRKFMLKRFPTNVYMDCPVPKEYWEVIQEYAEAFVQSSQKEVSDEEINKEAVRRAITNTDLIREPERAWFEKGAKWYRSQLKK